MGALNQLQLLNLELLAISSNHRERPIQYQYEEVITLQTTVSDKEHCIYKEQFSAIRLFSMSYRLTLFL